VDLLHHGGGQRHEGVPGGHEVHLNIHRASC
jgi:hypothetical protein